MPGVLWGMPPQNPGMDVHAMLRWMVVAVGAAGVMLGFLLVCERSIGPQTGGLEELVQGQLLQRLDLVELRCPNVPPLLVSRFGNWPSVLRLERM